jgi:F0F1-type ATP synthase membrane subunit b/b'
MEIVPDPVHVALLALPFACAALALHLILWRPLLAWMDERDATADTARREAAELDAAAAEQLSRIEGRLQDARSHVSTLRQAARLRAQAQEAEIVAAARTSAEARIDGALARIRGEHAVASAGLRETANVLARDIAARVLGRKVA